jgi:hypothetical protein
LLTDAAASDADAAATRPIAFVSSQVQRGDLGLPAFNQLCQQAATTAGLPGTYAALLGTPVASPVEALRSTTWYRTDGQLLFNGSMAATVRGFLTETKQVLPGSALVWTGGMLSQNNCSD